MQPGTQGGGFMAGAMQTAMGVAGGMLLANAVSGMFGSDAQAAETPAPAAEPAPEPEAQVESGGEEDGGFFGGGDEEEF
jgi:membrane protease subunit (stomatin/prohibitin family)